MMEDTHKSRAYKIDVAWTGNRGEGTIGYTAYERSHDISAAGKPVIRGSSDAAFRGDSSKYNPEELLVASLSACHLLSYLHLCAVAHIVVTGYTDKAHGTMIQTADGGGRFTDVTLHPAVTIKDGCDPKLAEALHARAHHLCFIANSVNFTVRVEPLITVE